MLCIAFQTHCLEGDLKCKSWPLTTHWVGWLICNYLWERLMTLSQPSWHTYMSYSNITWRWNVHRTCSFLHFSGAFISINNLPESLFSEINTLVCSVEVEKRKYCTVAYWIHTVDNINMSCSCITLLSLPSFESWSNIKTLWALFSFCKTVTTKMLVCILWIY